jgi:hypothetical protein
MPSDEKRNEVKAILNLIRWRVAVLLALLASPAFTIPAFAIWDKPGVIAYHDWSGEVRIYDFAEGDQHTLVVTSMPRAGVVSTSSPCPKTTTWSSSIALLHCDDTST